MTHIYRNEHEPAKQEPVKPVVVGSQPDAKPKKCVSVIVERTGLFWWFLRGISMGGGFALVWYGLQAVM